MRARLARPRWWRGFTIQRTFQEAIRTCVPPPAAGVGRPGPRRGVSPPHTAPPKCVAEGGRQRGTSARGPWGCARGRGPP
eukprot:7370582-Alexandrium_andersonii.AAC.1